MNKTMRKILYVPYQPYKWLIYLPLFCISTIIFALLAVILAFFVNDRIASYVGGVLWSRINSWMAPISVNVNGRENIDPGQSYVVIANHQSAFDIFVLYGFLGIDFKWVMKQEVRKIPGIGIGCEKVGHIFIDRTNHDSAIRSLNEAKNLFPGKVSMRIHEPISLKGYSDDNIDALVNKAQRIMIDSVDA